MYYAERKLITTKYSPYEIIWKIFQETFLTKVKNNTIKSRKNLKIEKYQINQKVMIYPVYNSAYKRKNYVNYKKPDIVSKSKLLKIGKLKLK